MHEPDEHMTAELSRAVHLLRQEGEPRPEFRDGIVRQLAATVPPRRVPVWSMRPLTALAAGLCCALAGAGAYAAWIGTRLPGESMAVEAAAATVRFRFDAPGAGTVSLAGDFNAWSATSLPLTRAADGRTWVIDVPLSPGRYAYAFVVDGDLQVDPGAPRATDDDFGAPSSVVLVRGS